MTKYPPSWPRCSCGDYVLDGHLTCGRVECDESAARARNAVRDWMRRGKAAQDAVDRILGKRERPK